MAEIPDRMDLRPEKHVIVIFGARGDLSRRKLIPALWHLHMEGLLPSDYRVVGNSRGELAGSLDDLLRRSVQEFGMCEVEEAEWGKFVRRWTYVAHEFNSSDPAPLVRAVEKAEADLGGTRRLYYLAVPPDAFLSILEGLRSAGLHQKSRVIVEKPFGRDLNSFRKLDVAARDFLEEDQVYRIDHFLGKETVQNILALRFANGMFEPSWNRHHIDHVQIDVPEELGIGSRGSFYEETGTLRDMLVTHLFQVLGFVAMEPPPSLEPRPLAEEVLKVFESMQPLETTDLIRGQYEGYKDESDVNPESETETFVAARIRIDNWRWAGVPFYLRTGKRMAESRQSVTLAFRDPPRQMFKEVPGDWFEQDHLTLELGPDEGIEVTFLAKVPGPTIELAPARMVFKYEGSFGSEMIGAYERLLHDALIGDRTLFTRGDGIERTWELVDGVLRSPPPLHGYEPGTWGPKAALDLIAPKRWHLPIHDT
ncbi:MAG: glucose-6-phosphate dehydrogenase [Actinomycetota bacterium]|nr:glucose-6-phosphate dehydrogenase [Actinomycetota bacterium]